jgi:hypothetical protein
MYRVDVKIGLATNRKAQPSHLGAGGLDRGTCGCETEANGKTAPLELMPDCIAWSRLFTIESLLLLKKLLRPPPAWHRRIPNYLLKFQYFAFTSSSLGT